MSRHRYGQLVPEMESYIREVLEENREEELIAELADYLQQEWNKQGRLSTSSAAEKKARAILDGEKLTHLPPKIHNTANLSRDGILRDALSKGYLYNVRIDEPWHPKPFLEGEIETFPFQHKEAVVYTGIEAQDFFTEEYTDDGTPFQKSALELGYIPSQSAYNDGKADLESPTENGPFIYAGFLKAASLFGEDAVLEIKVPVDVLSILVDNHNLGEFAREKGNYTSFSGLKGMQETFSRIAATGEKFDNPVQAFRYYCKKAETERGTRETEQVQFVVASQVELERVIGVWDMNYFDEPVFEPLSEYIKNLKGKHPDAVPKGVEGEEIRKKIEQELEALAEMEEIVEKINERIEFIRSTLVNIEEYRRQGKKVPPTLYSNLEKAIKGEAIHYSGSKDIDTSSVSYGYENLLYRLKRLFEVDFDVQIRFQKEINSIRSLEENIEDIEQLGGEIQQILQKSLHEEKKHQKKGGLD